MKFREVKDSIAGGFEKSFYVMLSQQCPFCLEAEPFRVLVVLNKV